MVITETVPIYIGVKCETRTATQIATSNVHTFINIIPWIYMRILVVVACDGHSLSMRRVVDLKRPSWVVKIRLWDELHVERHFFFDRKVGRPIMLR